MSSPGTAEEAPTTGRPGQASHAYYLGEIAFSALVGALLGASVLAGGGSTDRALLWIGGTALVVVAVLASGGLARLWPVPRPSGLATTAIVLLATFTVWNGLSIVWSFAPDLSWSYANRGLAYLALLLVGLFFGALVSRAPSVFAAMALVVVAAALVWALAGKVDPSLFEDGARRARLREPVGLWNLLAVLFAMGVPLGLWAAGRRYPIAVRGLATGFLFLLVPALALTLSRSGILAAILAVVLWVALVPGRLESLVALAVSVPAGIGLASWALDQPGLAEEGQSFAQRASDGRQLGLYLALGFAAAVVLASTLAALQRAWPLSERRHLQATAGAAAVAVVAIALLAAVFVARVGDPVAWVDDKIEELTSEELVANDPSRLGSASLNNRLDWWGEARDAFLDEPVAGTGAGSFPVVHRIYRQNELTVLEPHDLPLQLLAETGAIGALLGVGAILVALAAGIGALRRLDEPDRLAGVAIAIGAVLWALHALVEVDWDFLAVTGPVLLGLGVLIGANRVHHVQYRRIGVLVPIALLVTIAAASLTLPWLAERDVERSARLVLVDAQAALDAAERAGRLDPLALAPLLAQADARFVLGDPELARQAYVDATDLQPKNSEAWLALAEFELAEGNVGAARGVLRRVGELDPLGCRGRALAAEAGLPAAPCARPGG